MSALRVPLEGLVAGERELPAEQDRYVTRVHRTNVGDRFVVFDPAARLEAEAVLLAVSPARVRLSEPRAAQQVAERSITVVQCLSKGSKIDSVVRDATELGATRVIIAEAARSVRRAPGDDRVARWRRIALEAARQCGRGDVPEMIGTMALVEALALSPSGVRLLLHPAAERSFGELVRVAAANDPVTVAIGPEGGFADVELRDAAKAGYQVASLGRFVMRTETACAAALGALAAWLPDR